MKILVTGGRDFQGEVYLRDRLDKLRDALGFDTIIHGGQRGADRMAGRWGLEMGLVVITEQADWKQYGRRAGPIRNAKMLTWQPDLVVAFPGGRGTADMVKQAKAAGIKCVDPEGKELP